MINVLII